MTGSPRNCVFYVLANCMKRRRLKEQFYIGEPNDKKISAPDNAFNLFSSGSDLGGYTLPVTRLGNIDRGRLVQQALITALDIAAIVAKISRHHVVINSTSCR
jgi:hypothetical protein